MALWQYDTSLIPHARLLEQFGALPDAVTAEQAPSLHWDPQHQPPADTAARLAAFLPACASWSRDVSIWGSEVGDRVDVTLQQGRVATIRVRLDARNGTASPFLIRMVDFAQQCGGVFLTAQGRVIPAGVRPLLADLRQSPARRFVTHRSHRRLPLGGEEGTIRS